MSNYPNMSYCMCENTVAALRQILNALRDGEENILRGMGREERDAFGALPELCRQVSDAAEEVLEIAGEEDFDTEADMYGDNALED